MAKGRRMTGNESQLTTTAAAAPHSPASHCGRKHEPCAQHMWAYVRLCVCASVHTVAFVAPIGSKHLTSLYAIAVAEPSCVRACLLTRMHTHTRMRSCTARHSADQYTPAAETQSPTAKEAFVATPAIPPSRHAGRAYARMHHAHPDT